MSQRSLELGGGSGDEKIDESKNDGLIEIGVQDEKADGDTAHEESYPEGGFWGWSAVVGAVLIQFCCFGYCTAYGVFQDYYTRVYLTNASPSAISWIGSISSFLAIACSLFTGSLYDKGYFYHMLYGGSLLSAVSLFLLSFAKPNQPYQIFLAQGVAFGLGSGLTYLPSVAVVEQYFHKKQSLAMIIVVAGSALGPVVHPILLNQLLFHSNLGYANTIRASAGMVSGLLLIACLLMRSRNLPQPKTPDLRTVVMRSVRDVPFVCLSISLTAFTIGFYYPLYYLQLSAILHGVDQGFSFYLVTIMMSATVTGNIVPVFCIHLLGVPAMLVAGSALTAATTFAMVAVKDLSSSVTIAVLYGFGVGMSFGLQAPMITLLTEDKSELGARLGIGLTFVAIGALVGPPIHGALVTANYIWLRPAIFGGILGTLGTFGFALTEWLVRRKRRNHVTLTL